MFSTFKNYEGRYTYSNAESELGSSTFKPLGYNLYLVRINPETVGIRLYNTVIIKYHKDGSIQLYAEGWQTPTTSMAINKSLIGFGVSSVKGEWVVYSTEKFIYYHFEDGILIDADSNIHGRPLYLDDAENSTGETFENDAALVEYIKKADAPILKKFFRKRALRELVAKYAYLEFIPLIVTKAGINDHWGELARARMC